MQYFWLEIQDLHLKDPKEHESLNTQSCIKGLLVVRISVSGPFGQPGQYIKKSWGPIMSNFRVRFFMFSDSNYFF